MHSTMTASDDRRRNIVRDVLSAVDGRDADALTVSDLCRIAKVSKRTLYYAFRAEIQLSPARYLKLKRLEGAHRDLSRPDPAGSSVTDIANRWGFWHMGQFARDYYALFGKLPSETRRSGPRSG